MLESRRPPPCSQSEPEAIEADALCKQLAGVVEDGWEHLAPCCWHGAHPHQPRCCCPVHDRCTALYCVAEPATCLAQDDEREVAGQQVLRRGAETYS